MTSAQGYNWRVRSWVLVVCDQFSNTRIAMSHDTHAIAFEFTEINYTLCTGAPAGTGIAILEYD